MRRVPIRLKLTAALALPLTALVVVTLLEVRSISSDLDRVREQTELAEMSLGPSSVINALLQERSTATAFLINQQGAFGLQVATNAEARTRTDEALERFRADLDERDDLLDTYAPAFEALEALPTLREQVDQYEGGARNLGNVEVAAQSFDGYSEVLQAFFSANEDVVRSISESDLRRGAELFYLSSRQDDTIARLVRDLLIPAVGGGVDEPAEIDRIAESLSHLRMFEQDIETKAAQEYAPLAEALFATPHVQRFPQLAEEAIEQGAVDTPQVVINATGDDPSTDGYAVFRDGVADLLTDRVESSRAEAEDRLRRYVLLAVLAGGFAVAVTWLVSRSITRPLRSLTRQAREMASIRLPAAVGEILETPLGDDVALPSSRSVSVRSRDEVADVAAALNTVQQSALELAVEQAVLRRNIADSFVNLGRRNQSLLGRQLDFITHLESNEADPDALAALFRLDHLATRMRRNAESLLVLAGIEPPRKWSAPQRLSDVIRGALGEVEDFNRVVVNDLEPATVLGATASDIAHLVAEFVENALTFSPPEQAVEIRGRRLPGGGYALNIVDAGFGMPEVEIGRANRRLAGAESFTIAPSKYLGHYVAGHLAARHGVVLRLEPAPGTGVTAVIELPPGVLASEGAAVGRSVPPGLRPYPASRPSEGARVPAPVPVPRGPGVLPGPPVGGALPSAPQDRR